MIAVELTLQQLKAAISQLSPAEKLELNEVMWDETSEIPQEHQDLVNERLKRADANPESLIDWKDAKRMLNL